jgi:hypothetical protein
MTQRDGRGSADARTGTSNQCFLSFQDFFDWALGHNDVGIFFLTHFVFSVVDAKNKCQSPKTKFQINHKNQIRNANQNILSICKVAARGDYIIRCSIFSLGSYLVWKLFEIWCF